MCVVTNGGRRQWINPGTPIPVVYNSWSLVYWVSWLEFHDGVIADDTRAGEVGLIIGYFGVQHD